MAASASQSAAIADSSRQAAPAANEPVLRDLRVRISGIDGEILDNVRAYLSLASYGDDLRIRSVLPARESTPVRTPQAEPVPADAIASAAAVSDEPPTQSDRDGALDQPASDADAAADTAPANADADADDSPPDEPIISEARMMSLHQGAAAQIRNALMPYGYYHPQIEADLTLQGDRWTADYRIDAGTPTRIGQVTVQVIGAGADHAAVVQALASAELKSGERLLHSRYDAAKASLFNTAYDAGYLDAQFVQHELLVHLDAQRADIALVLDTGPRFYFGDVTFSESALDPALLQRYVPFRPEDPFNANELLQLQLALEDSGYFRQVRVTPERAAKATPASAPATESPTESVPPTESAAASNRAATPESDAASADARSAVTYDTSPNPRPRIPITVHAPDGDFARYSAGAGYGTDTGPRVNLGVAFPRVNAQGHHVRADLRASAIDLALAARYEIPIGDVRRDSLSFNASAERKQRGDVTTQQFQVGAARSDTWLGFRRSLYLQLSRENFEFDHEPQRDATLLYPGITLTRQRSDDIRYPRSGYSLSLDMHGGSASALSETDFARASAEARYVLAMGERSRLLLHAGAGALYTDNFDALPPSQRFFTGGDRSVRGYELDKIGGRNPLGDVIGGKQWLLASVEVDTLVYGDYGIAAFFDAGSAQPPGNIELSKSAGIGLRWRSPIGMVRLDFAHPLDDDKTSVRFHLSLGPDL